MANRIYTAEYKESHELPNCEVGRKVILIFTDGQEYHGIFRGMDDDETIMLKSEVKNPTTIGLPIKYLKFWLLKDK